MLPAAQRVLAHPAALGWLGSVRGHFCEPLGVDRFGQAGDIAALYSEYGIDTETAVDAVADVVVRHVQGLALAAE